MKGVFFVKAATFINENMMPCSYGTYEENELKAMNVWLDKERKDRLSERGKTHQEKFQELEKLFPQIFEQVEKHLTTESVLPEVVEIFTPSVVQVTSKLEVCLQVLKSL